MEHLNTFIGGMNKDISKSLFKEGNYIHAENFTLITDVGLSTGSLRNTNGNDIFISFPDCSNTYQITSVTGPSVTVDVNGISISYTASTIEQLGIAMQADPAWASSSIGVAYTDTRIVIYSLDITTVPSVTVTLVNAAGSQDLSPITSSNIKIIGWVTIRDQIILFTANTSAANQVGQTGQVWKLVYDKYSNNPILTLIYNGYLNFSLATPIANPGAAIGNYETPTIQKVYWTDNYNRPKVMNIADPNTMALTPELIEVVSDITRGVATIYDVPGSGNIKTGLYQVSARLTVTSGGASTFLTPSNIVTIINEPETSSYGTYEARDSGTYVSKSIAARLYNLDTKYDRVEPVVLYRETPNATPDIYLLPSQPINNNGQQNFYFTGNETTIPISLEEFIAEGIVFDTVKTLAAKNNILFYGNVKYSDFDVDFDARAYRFTGQNANVPRIATVREYSGQTYQISGTAPVWTVVPPTSDAIQDINDQAPDSLDNYLFQSDGLTYGGEGPNVKYEFVPMSTMNDQSASAPFRTVLDDSKIYSGVIVAPYAFVKGSVKNVNLSLNVPPDTGYSQVFQDTISFDNGSGPFGSYTARGYQRDEMYRFGIVFYSKKGQPSYVHWIADIRMPKPFMPSNFYSGPTGSNNRDYLGFPISSVDSPVFGATPTSDEVAVGSANIYSGNQNKILYGNNLGVKFTVTLPASVKNLISGYSIVRVERTDQDKTILGQGMFSPTYYSGNGVTDGDRHYFTAAFENSFTFSVGTGAADETFRNTMGGISSPEFLFKNPPSFSLGDEIDIIQTNASLGFIVMDDGTQFAPLGGAIKYYLPCSIKSMAPKAAKINTPAPGQVTDPNQKTPIPLTETLQFSKGQALYPGLSLRSWGYSGGDVSNYGWPNGNAPQGDGGTRLFTGFGGDPGGVPIPNLPYRVNALHSVALGVAASYPAFSFLAAAAQPWAGLIYEDGITNQSTAATPGGSIYIGNYRRPNTVQYGGNTYSERSYNEYISTGHTQIIDANSLSTNTSMVFGGDTYITLFDYGDQLKSYVGAAAVGGTAKNRYDHTRSTVFLIPVECSFPVEWRKQNSLPAGAVDDGYTTNPRCAPNKSNIYADLPNLARIYCGFASDPNAPTTTAEWTENFDIELDYVGESNVTKYFPLPDPYNPQNVFDVRIHRSQIKTNGELTDSWGIFKTEDYLDLDTIQGPLNNLMIYQNAMVGFQDKGIALVSVRERSLTQDSSGSEIVLGSGGILERYDYISRVIGSRHQFGFTSSQDSIFFFDMNTKNMYRLQGQSPVAITVAKGMSSYLSNNLFGLIQTHDNPYLHKGITATYDFRYNESIMTFRDSVVDTTKSLKTFLVGSLNPNIYIFSAVVTPIWLVPNSDVLVVNNTTGNEYPGVVVVGAGGINIDIPESPTILATDQISLFPYTKNAFTIAYNDIISGYTSFYSYTPAVYVNDYVSIFSPDDTINTLYRHEVGQHSTYYGTKYPSKLTLLVNPSPTETKVFDNYELVCESIDINGVHQTNDLFNRIRLYNDYQNTDFQTLPIDGTKGIAKRKERTWNISNLRNRVLYVTSNSPDIFSTNELSTYTLVQPQTVLGDKVFGERMRDKYLTINLEYDNLNNYNYIVHTFKTHFRKSAR